MDAFYLLDTGTKYLTTDKSRNLGQFPDLPPGDYVVFATVEASFRENFYYALELRLMLSGQKSVVVVRDEGEVTRTLMVAGHVIAQNAAVVESPLQQPKLKASIGAVGGGLQAVPIVPTLYGQVVTLPGGDSVPPFDAQVTKFLATVNSATLTALRVDSVEIRHLTVSDAEPILFPDPGY